LGLLRWLGHIIWKGRSISLSAWQRMAEANFKVISKHWKAVLRPSRSSVIWHTGLISDLLHEVIGAVRRRRYRCSYFPHLPNFEVYSPVACTSTGHGPCHIREITTPPKLLLKASIVSEMAVNLGSIRRSPVMQDEQFYD
jgi:hypothetical protein